MGYFLKWITLEGARAFDTRQILHMDVDLPGFSLWGDQAVNSTSREATGSV